MVKQKDKMSRKILIACNILLIISVVAASIIYSVRIHKGQEDIKQRDFVLTVDAMKQVSQNYLSNERGYVRNWATYISSEGMTLEEAMEFLRSINTNPERIAHIVDMDTYQAYSAYYPAGEEAIDTYLKYTKDHTDYNDSFLQNMQQIFDGTDEQAGVLGKYQLTETKASAIGVGSRVTLKTKDGTKDYLLLRVIPADSIKKSWVFPVEYSSAEVGIITNAGDYVIQSNSMKSTSFPEYIRGYNFQDDYNQVNALVERLQSTDNGTLYYKNFRGQECLWYYSSFGGKSTLDILGVVNLDELKASLDVWLIVIMISGTLLLLVAVDGLYLYRINCQLRETAVLANQASEAKTQFLSAMSHDIRTPMNAVLGMMTIAQNNVHDPDYVRECLDKALHAGRQLLTLLNDVLDISKIESGKVVLNPQEVDLGDCIHDLQEMLRPSMEEKNIVFHCDCDKLPHRYVMADEMRLNQIYVNLLSNAVKYTNNGGTIDLRIYEETILPDRTCTRLIFRVSDNGIGMSAEFQQTMYQSFARAVSTQVNRTQGSGLGLSIVKQMVDLMGGTIDCESVPGEGTTFTVKLDLPIVQKQETKVTEAAEPQTRLSDLHLLVAEDNDLNWEIIEVLLLEHGVTCDRAENGEVCVEMLKAAADGVYDAILMDIQMPVMNGMEATRVIRALPDDKRNRIPIVAMTADAFAEDVQACLDCGMNGHISKPVDINKLFTYLQKIQTNKW